MQLVYVRSSLWLIPTRCLVRDPWPMGNEREGEKGKMSVDNVASIVDTRTFPPIAAN